jgi:hypothetical protein
MRNCPSKYPFLIGALSALGAVLVFGAQGMLLPAVIVTTACLCLLRKKIEADDC